MIIQALNECYERLKRDPNSNIPLFGFSRGKIHFALVLDKSGKFIDVNDLREQSNNKNIPRELIVPAGDERIPGLNIPRASGIRSNFMWGNTGYVLGRGNKDKPERARKTFEVFKRFHHELGDAIDNEGMRAVLYFLDSWQPKKLEQTKCREYWEEMAGMNVVFRLSGERKYIYEHSVIQDKWLEYCKEKQSEYIDKASCLVSGQKKSVVKLHPSIKGVKNAQSSGASIVSFNLDSFCSYNKEQSFNAPVSEDIVFNYTTALNHLLQFESRQRVQIGDATTVFWAEGPTPVEGFLKDILDPPKDNQAKLGDLRRFLEAVREGKMPREIENAKNMKFYILGLSPNASRLSVRFWYVSTVEDISKKIGQHFKDLAIIKNYDNESEFPGMWHLLHELAPQREIDKLSPLLAGLFMRAILTGERYPSNLLSTIINRIRAEQSLKNKNTGKPMENVTYLRASMIKAYLVRNWRFQKRKEKEVAMSLNKDEKDIGYLLGRLFAVCEKVQQDALGRDINATIKDKFYSSASATPGVVYPRLFRLAQYHLRSIDNLAFRVTDDRLIQEIIGNIPKFPSYLNLEEQGRFAIGYYHQKQDFYKKTDKKEE